MPSGKTDHRIVSFEGSYPRYSALPDGSLPEIGLLGRSNVGKSSLINLLAARKRLALTSATPGKTKTFNLYKVDEDFYLVDVPGLGYARSSRSERNRWEVELARYIRERDQLKAVLLLMDSRHAPTSGDRDAMQFLKDARRPTVVVLTKCDKLSGNGRAKAKRAVAAAMEEMLVEWPVVETSSKTGRGKDALLEWIDRLAAVD